MPTYDKPGPRSHSQLNTTMDQFRGSDVDKYRSFMSGEGEKNTTWRYGAPPNYDAANKLFEEGRTKIWPKGSLEEQVQNLVKTWEMEMVYKVNTQDYKAVDVTKLAISVNGRRPMTAEDIAKIGGYNMFLQTSFPGQNQVYNPNEETADTAQKVFTTTFARGFVIEVLEVYSGPPVIAYKFRHWGYMDGPFKGHQPTKELVEMYGVSIFKLDEHFKIVKIEFFYDGRELLTGLIKGGTVSATRDSSADVESSRCPFS